MIREPYLDKVIDLSLQLIPGRSSMEIRHVEVGPRFEYCGTRLGRSLSHLDEKLRRYIHGEVAESWREFALGVKRRLLDKGYDGPAGLDGLIYRDGDGFGFHPLVEINPRWTMGHVALGVEKRLAHLRPRELKIINVSEYEGLRESKNIFPLTDPHTAAQKVAVVIS